MRLRDLTDELGLTFELLQALNLVLELDRQFPSDFSEDGTVGYMVDSCRGFDEIEQLQYH